MCPHARDILWHGSTPLQPYQYPTGEEASKDHENLLHKAEDAALGALEDSGLRLARYWREYELNLTITRDGEKLCARSKADLVIMAGKPSGRGLLLLYVEAATRIHAAKPWQALLRGIALYYRYRVPTWIILVSPDRIMYKLLAEEDQGKILKKLNRSSSSHEPSPNLCSLCELAHQCPYKVI